MTITLRYYDRYYPRTFGKPCRAYEKLFDGKTASELMSKVEDFRRDLDYEKYTSIEIVNIED